jgi:hypothetical protein
LARHVYRVKLSELQEQDRKKVIDGAVNSAEPELVST